MTFRDFFYYGQGFLDIQYERSLDILLARRTES